MHVSLMCEYLWFAYGNVNIFPSYGMYVGTAKHQITSMPL